MSRRCLLLAAVLGFQANPAAAEESAAAETRAGFPDMAVGVNAPWGWPSGVLGASVYVGIANHHAIRGNFARFHVDESFNLPLNIATGGGASAPHGTIYDVGASWVYYPRRLWDGLMIEAGILRRDRDTVHWPEMEPKTSSDTVAYSGRAMLGWSWRLGRYAFIAAAVGGAFGIESGVKTVDEDGYQTMPVTSPVHRKQGDLETYLRIGITFGG